MYIYEYMHVYTYSPNNRCMYYSEYLEMSVQKCLHNVFAKQIYSACAYTVLKENMEVINTYFNLTNTY